MSKSSRFRCNFSLHSSQVVTASREEPGGEGQGKVSVKWQRSIKQGTITQALQILTSSWLYIAKQESLYYKYTACCCQNVNTTECLFSIQLHIFCLVFIPGSICLLLEVCIKSLLVQFEFYIVIQTYTETVITLCLENKQVYSGFMYYSVKYFKFISPTD